MDVDIYIFRVFRYLLEAAHLNNTQAQEYVAMAHLLGDHLPRDWEKAKSMLVELSNGGSPRGQMVSRKNRATLLIIRTNTG